MPFYGEKINFDAARVGAEFCYTSEMKKGKKFHIFFIYILPYDLLRRHVFASCSTMSKIVNKVVKENTRNCALEAREARKTILLTINLHFSWMCFTFNVCTATCWKLKRHLREIAGWCDLQVEHPPFGVSQTFLARGCMIHLDSERPFDVEKDFHFSESEAGLGLNLYSREVLSNIKTS